MIIFCGDLNARIGKKLDTEVDIDMDLPQRVPLDHTENSHGKQFIEFLKNCKLCVLNGRFDCRNDNFTSVGRGKSVVDYFFCPHNMLQFCTNFEVVLSKEMANQHGYTGLIGKGSKLSDHSLLKVKINILADCPHPYSNLPHPHTSNDNTSNVTGEVKYNVKNIPNDFFSSVDSRNKLLELINEQELAIENQNNVNRYYNDLITCIFNEMDQYLPKLYGYGTKSKKRFRVKKPYWNENLKQLWLTMCQHEKEFLRFRGHNHIKQHLRTRFNNSSSIFHRELRKAERAHNRTVRNEIESVCTENPKQFWSYIKKLGPRYTPDIPQEVYDDDGNIKTDIDSVLTKWKTEYEKLYKTDPTQFNTEFYSQIMELLRNAENRMDDPLYTPNSTLNRNISADEINFVVNKLKNNKSPGIDKIPNEVLKSTAVKNCLLKLYQYYFDTGIFPSCWNQAIIKPIPKSKTKDPRIPLNYRGINLLSNIYKAYSSIINRRLSIYLETNELLEDVQNGFRKDRNCLDHIYVLYSIIRNRKNRSLDTFVSYIDFYKCFDVVDRNLLFFKLTEYGIDGKIYDECHAKIDLYKVKKIGNFLVLKIV